MKDNISRVTNKARIYYLAIKRLNGLPPKLTRQLKVLHSHINFWFRRFCWVPTEIESNAEDIKNIRCSLETGSSSNHESFYGHTIVNYWCGSRISSNRLSASRKIFESLDKLAQTIWQSFLLDLSEKLEQQDSVYPSTFSNFSMRV